MFLGAILHSGVGKLVFWGSFAKKYKPFGESRIQFGESETFWQNLIRFGKSETIWQNPIQSGKTLYNLAKSDSFAKLYRVLPKSIGVSPNSVWRIDKKIMGK